MKNYAHAALATGMAGAFALATMAGSASAAEVTGGTPDDAHWYIGSGNAYGEVLWDDHHPFQGDADILTLKDDLAPPGYSVRMKVDFGSYVERVRASHGQSRSVYLGARNFAKGDKVRFKACAWDNGKLVTCRPWTTVTE